MEVVGQIPPPPKRLEEKVSIPTFNFCKASNRDAIIFGAERPGYIHPSRKLPSTPRGPNIDSVEVDKWTTYMKSNGIRRILCLLNIEELGFYDSPIIDNLKNTFSCVTHVNIRVDIPLCPMKPIMEALISAEESGDPIVVFCSTGQGRTSHALAMWLHRRYLLSIEESVEEIRGFASSQGATRKPTVEGVSRLLMGTGNSVISWRESNIARASTQQKLHVTFIQMGGEIDKDYTSEGVSNEIQIGESASKRIMRNIQTAFTYDSVTVCRRDRKEVNDKDRSLLLEVLGKIPTTKVIVTCDTSSIIEISQFVDRNSLSRFKAILFTGARKPEKMIDSDAAFNIGLAVGGLNVLDYGVYICLNGRILRASRCRLNSETGLIEG